MLRPAPPPTLTPTGVRYGVLAFACSLSLVTYLDRICIMRAAEDIKRDLGFSSNQMGLVFSAFVLGYLLFEVPGGWMGDRWGSRRVLTRIVLCWSLFTALTGSVGAFALDSGYRLALGGFVVPLVLDSLTLMLLVRFLFGAGEAGAYPNVTRVTRDWFPFRERAFAQGAVWMSARLGGAFAPLVLGRLSVLLGWRHAFWVLGAVGVVWAVLFYLWFRDRPEQHPSCNAAERALILGGSAGEPPRRQERQDRTRQPSEQPSEAIVGEEDFGISSSPLPWRSSRLGGSISPPPAHETHSWPGLGTLARSLTVWALCAASFCVCLGWYFYPTWQPRYLKDVHGFEYDSHWSEVLTGLPFLFGAVGALAGGRLSDWLVGRTGSRRWGRSLVGFAGFAGAGTCVMATGFATSAWQAVLLLCLASLVNDLAIPVIWAACADVGGRYAGTVSGVMNMAGGLGALLSPALIPRVLGLLEGRYAGAVQWRIIFAGMACAWFVGAAAWLLVDAGKPLAANAERGTRNGE